MAECNISLNNSCGERIKGCCEGDNVKCVKERANSLHGKCIKTDWNVGVLDGKKIFTYGSLETPIFAHDVVNLRAVLKQDYKYDNTYVYKNDERVVINLKGSVHHGKTGRFKFKKTNYDLSTVHHMVHLDDAVSVLDYTEFLHENIAPIREVFGYLPKNLTDNSEYMNNWVNVSENALMVNPGELVPTHYKWMMKEGEEAGADAGGGRRKRKTRRLKKKAKKAKKTNRKIKKKKRRSRTRTRKRSKGRKKH